MKVLFVDDESKKIKNLNAVISRIDGAELVYLDNVLDLNAAKNKLVDTCYDLVIMDLQIVLGPLACGAAVVGDVEIVKKKKNDKRSL